MQFRFALSDFRFVAVTTDLLALATFSYTKSGRQSANLIDQVYAYGANTARTSRERGKSVITRLGNAL